MIWLLTEILVFVLAAALFGGLIGLGLANARASRSSTSFDEEHQGLLERMADFERTQRTIGAKAGARAAAEAAVRGELESRLVETEAAAADFRVRAEAAERNVRAADAPGEVSGPLIEAVVLSNPATDTDEMAGLRDAADAAETARAKLESDLRGAETERDAAQKAADAAAETAAAERARIADEAAADRERRRQEVESLNAQLAAAERMRAKSEGELALAHARAQEVMRVAAALMGQAGAAGALPAGAGFSFPLPPSAEAGQGASRTAGDGAAIGDKPSALPAPRGGRPDDLRRIKGVGIKNEGVLNALGIYHFEQIAVFTPANVEWLDAHLKFQGRIAREDWVGQAKALMAARENSAAKVHPDDAGV